MTFDVSRQTFRSQEYAEAKAGDRPRRPSSSGRCRWSARSPTPSASGLLRLRGCEADDVIATLTSQAVAAGMDVLVCSGDRDTFQLVGDQVTVLYPVRGGLRELSRMDPGAVEAWYGVPPALYSDLAALGGVLRQPPRCPRCRAQDCGEVADHLRRAPAPSSRGSTRSAARSAVAAGPPRPGAAQPPAQPAVRDLPPPVTPDDLERRSWDREEVHTVFDGLEFRVLRDRLFATSRRRRPRWRRASPSTATSSSRGSVAAWLAAHTASGRTGVHVDGLVGPGVGDVEGIGLAAADAAAAYPRCHPTRPGGRRGAGRVAGRPHPAQAMHDGRAGPGARFAGLGAAWAHLRHRARRLPRPP